jgi:hypothetical protein
MMTELELKRYKILVLRNQFIAQRNRLRSIFQEIDRVAKEVFPDE